MLFNSPSERFILISVHIIAGNSKAQRWISFLSATTLNLKTLYLRERGEKRQKQMTSIRTRTKIHRFWKNRHQQERTNKKKTGY